MCPEQTVKANAVSPVFWQIAVEQKLSKKYGIFEFECMQGSFSNWGKYYLTLLTVQRLEHCKVILQIDYIKKWKL